MTTEANLLHGIVHDRIRDLLHDRRWYRANACAANWSEVRKAVDVELLALVRLARQARRQAEPEQADPITVTKGYYDWREGESYHDFQARGPR